MRFFYDNVVAIQVAVVCSAFAWLFGGTISTALLPTIPWLFAILLEVLICFPQRHAGETTYEARARVWKHLGADPLTWIVIGFTFMLMVPFFNKGLCPCCDYPAINFEGQSQGAPVPFIPFCVNRMEHLNVVLWFVPALVTMLAVKHALLKRGKRALLGLIVWNGLALSIVGMIQSVTGAQGPLWAELEGTKAYFFSTFGYPNMAGDYFTTLFGLAVGLWRWNVEEAKKEEKESGVKTSQTNHKAFWRRHLLLVPALVFFFSALMTLSRASILLVSSLAIIFFVHTFTSMVSKMKKVKRVKVTAVNLIVLVIIVTLFFVFMSDDMRSQIVAGKDRDIVDAESAESASDQTANSLREDFKKELSTIDMFEVLERTSGHAQYHTSVALRIWKDHPFFGCGGWGYKHLCVPKMTDEEFAELQNVGGINVHNDYLQIMAEHGAVGLLLFLSCIVLLASPIFRIWKSIISAMRFVKPKDQPAKPIAIFALPAPVFCILATALATMIHALGDCPLRSPAILTLFLVSLAAADGFLPRVKDGH